MPNLKSYPQAIKFIYAHIPSRKDLFPRNIGLTRTKYFLSLLGDPQNDFKSIHIAGTSGKGSTATIISKLLQANGYKTDLTLSPHISDIRERIQINNELISKSDFLDILNNMMPAIKESEKSKYGHPTYFEILIAIYFMACKINNVDYAVIETGLGGRIDGTNVITRNDKVSIISNIGKDHTHILGNTLKAIAAEKGGIINKDSHCFLVNQNKEINDTIINICDNQNTTLQLVKPKNITDITISNNLMSFSLKESILDIKEIKTSLLGTHQAQNIYLALNVLNYLKIRDNLILKKDSTLNTLKTMFFTGRLEPIKYLGKTIYLDGAHNPQKMRALVKSLKLITIEKYDVILAIKAGKDFKQIIDTLLPITNKFILTTFKINQENSGNCVDPMLIKKYIQNNSDIDTIIIKDTKQAVNELVKSDNPKVITGSLYLLAGIKTII